MLNRVAAAMLAGLLIGCLPLDETPLTEVMVTLEGRQEFAPGTSMTSADGWELTLEHSVLGLHTLSLFRADGGGDADAAVSGYARVLSTSWSEPQKVALLFARGTCHFEYQLGRLPGTHNVQGAIVFGPSVSEADRIALSETVQAFSLEAASEDSETGAFRDVVAPDWFVQGQATKDGEEKRFRWLFWQLSPAREGTCSPGQLPSLSLSGGDGITLELSSRAESLFQSSWDSGDESLYFDQLARLDADEDGWISQVELEQHDEMSGEHRSPYERTVARLKEELTHISSPVRCLAAEDR